jgi:hypothetical protein
MREVPRRSSSRRIYSLLVLVVAIVVSGYLYRNYKRAQQRDEQEYAEEERQMQRIIASMSSRWDANTDWLDGFKGPLPSSIYTSDVETAVLGDRPILLYAHLDDIRTTGASYTAELSSPATQWLVHMHYRLLCDSTVAKKLVGEKQKDLMAIFAVVAHIDHVEKREEQDSSYFLADGTAKEATFVGVRFFGLDHPNVRKN